MGVSVLLRLFISSNEVCNTAYALQHIHEQNSICHPSTRRFVLCLTLYHFVLVFFSPFSIAITSLGEERANFNAFRTFVRFVLVWICRFPLPLGCLGRSALCDYGTSWTFFLPFFFFQRYHNGSSDPKGNENIIYTVVN